MVKQSFRYKQIENEYNSNIKDLLYQMHWSSNMMHREIGEQLDVPRPTITRWFRLLNIPSQSCHRFTDKNLTSWLYKTGKLKKKLRYEGPDRRIQRTKGNVNIDFFKTWSKEMAYILGFFAADGGMFINSGGSRYLQFTSTDYEILEKIKNLLLAKQKISLKKKSSKNHKDCYLLQVGSKEMFDDLKRLGFTPKKELNVKVPNIQDKYFSHFLRGYFDGDGCISKCWYKKNDRKNKTSIVFLVFVSGSKRFLRELSARLGRKLSIGKGYLYTHKNSSWLRYGKREAGKIYNFMYLDAYPAIFLTRKYNKFKEIFN